MASLLSECWLVSLFFLLDWSLYKLGEKFCANMNIDGFIVECMLACVPFFYLIGLLICKLGGKCCANIDGFVMSLF